MLRRWRLGRDCSRTFVWEGSWIGWIVLFAVLLSFMGSVLAAPPSSEGGAAEPTTPADGGEQPAAPDPGEDPNRAEADARALAASSVLERATQIEALLAGELDPSVDAAGLFVFALGDPGPGGEGVALRTLLESVQSARDLLATQAAARAAAQAEAAAHPGRRLPRPEQAVLPTAPELPGPSADALTQAQARLTRACWSFLILPADARASMLVAHEERRHAAADAREAEAAAKVRLAQLQRESEQLEALIADELDVSIDPQALLQVNLGDPRELGDESRLARFLGQKPTPEPGSDPDSDPSSDPDSGPGPPTQDPNQAEPAKPLAVEVAAAQDRLDALRMQFLALDASAQRALLEAHAIRQREAEQLAEAAKLLEADEEIVAQVEEELTEAEDKAAEARREREQAEHAAVVARSEALRRIAEERARLLGIKEAHANYEVELAKRKRATQEAHEIALGMNHQVAELAKQVASSQREREADAVYEPLRVALEDARARLDDTLTTIARSDSGVTSVGETLSGLPQGIDRSEIADLRAEIEASEAALILDEREVVWAAADSGRDDIVMLNEARLELLEFASAPLRDRMTGFGADGVAQVRREAQQIGLELRYRVLSLPRLFRGLIAGLEQAPVPILFSLLQLVFAVLLFRYWRKRADPTLESWRDYFHQRERGNTRLNSTLALGLWYFDRVRRPLELLAFFWIVFRVLQGEQAQLELEVVWLILLWLLLGSTVILLVDSIAAHENLMYGGGSNERALLRIRSLRMVGLTVVLSGLVLSLTAETVGEGATYHWVGSLVWFAAIPVLGVLIRWWREPAFRRIQDDPEIPENALIRWIRANTQGLASFAAAALAGIYLFSRGLTHWLLNRAMAFESIRRLLAAMSRREVARQASARREDALPDRGLDPDDYAHFEPDLVPEVDELSTVMAGVGHDLIEEIITLKMAHRGTLSAVIGERGAGKSTFLRRLAFELENRAEDYVHVGEEPAGEGKDDPEDERHEEYGRLTIRRLQCPPGGFRMLQKAIAESLGLSRNTPRDGVIAALSEQTPLVFLIDDVHRLVRPAIGGLAGLDDFADFAREVSGDASWIASIGSAAWQYVSRARGARVLFDQVLSLPSWNEQQIGSLIRERSLVARLRPSFDEIVIPQQFDVSAFAELEADLRPSSEQRAERGYYRILWDYAAGNPAVALHFWRESLRVIDSAGEDRIKVRLFSEPPATALDEVGPSMHFVLRGVVQLEIASPADLVACTQLAPADIADALRFAVARGWINRVGRRGERYRVTWHWYRAITNMLRRQHLLFM